MESSSKERKRGKRESIPSREEGRGEQEEAEREGKRAMLPVARHSWRNAARCSSGNSDPFPIHTERERKTFLEFLLFLFLASFFALTDIGVVEIQLGSDIVYHLYRTMAAFLLLLLLLDFFFSLGHGCARVYRHLKETRWRGRGRYVRYGPRQPHHGKKEDEEFPGKRRMLKD